jgi:hypothetical protein
MKKDATQRPWSIQKEIQGAILDDKAPSMRAAKSRQNNAGLMRGGMNHEDRPA